jgi:hypothetical protein
VDPRAGMDTVVKRKIPSPCRDSNPRTPIVQTVVQSLYRLSYHGSLVWLCFSIKFETKTKSQPTGNFIFTQILGY